MTPSTIIAFILGALTVAYLIGLQWYTVEFWPEFRRDFQQHPHYSDRIAFIIQLFALTVLFPITIPLCLFLLRKKRS